ncbi:MAG: flagellar positioning protein PflI [Caulobacter sp.]|nr:flagellar positioning protein PflI [Caulobacter sp.]
MSITAIALNGLLAVLLLVALAFGMRLERRLKALRDSHEGFAKAVADLDRAAMRAEQGLADLRAATDEAADTLGDRIAQAKALAAQLDERINRPIVTPPPATDRAERASRPVFDPPAEPAADQPRRRLKAEDFEKLLEREARIPRDAAPPTAPRVTAPKETPRSRARVDDDLFDGPDDGSSSNSTFRGRR